jgi:23S rRNA U2552 (ribose-2'-O)-methylase RlmE/FtsJ
MYRYKLNPIYEIIPLEIKIEKAPLNDKGFADILSINLEYAYKLNRAKNRINDINSLDWEEVKKITNPYEFIHAFNPKSKYNDNRSVSTLKPLSRSFFKMIEMINEFCSFLEKQDCSFLEKQDCSFLEKSRAKNGKENPARKVSAKNGEEIINYTRECEGLKPSRGSSREPSVPSQREPLVPSIPISSVHIAEGPGGFVEALRYVRKGCKDDFSFGMTLVKYDKNQYKNVHVPGWQKSHFFITNNPEVYIINGADGTGDIYKTENINYLNNELRNKSNVNHNGRSGAKFITADGGFDFSVEYNYQEQSSCKLIFSQILCALKCQKQNGTFICKFFDFNLYFTVEMLYLLYILYDTVVIYKPVTSRIANSEKYIICSNFKGMESLPVENFLDKLFNVLDQWNTYKEHTINHMFEKIPEDFIERIKTINAEIIDYQVKYINIAIDIIKTKKNSDKKWYETNINMQLQKAKEWCIKYNIPYKQDFENPARKL